jgi:hypothetical protein
MEMEKVMSDGEVVLGGPGDEEEDDEVVLPGYRFHPTDEELVTFYLRRKVARKSLRIEVIREMDIYKHDPWDLPSEFLSLHILYASCPDHAHLLMHMLPCMLINQPNLFLTVCSTYLSSFHWF